MAQLELRIDGEHVAATKVLLAASSCLKMLKAIKREVTGNRQAVIPWEVEIINSPYCVLIMFRTGEAGNQVAFDTAQEALSRLRTQA